MKMKNTMTFKKLSLATEVHIVWIANGHDDDYGRHIDGIYALEEMAINRANYLNRKAKIIKSKEPCSQDDWINQDRDDYYKYWDKEENSKFHNWNKATVESYKLK